MRIEIRRKDDGRGPYRWQPVVNTARGLALGTIYDSPQHIDAGVWGLAKGAIPDAYEWREVEA
jgi:hypothetical protein